MRPRASGRIAELDKYVFTTIIRHIIVNINKLKNMIKFKALNAKGFSHDLVLVLIVVVMAIGGTYYLVASHADSCPPVSAAVSDATSSPASSPTCTPVSSPTSAPDSSPVVTPTLAGNCSLTASPNPIASGQNATITITVNNTGNTSFTPSLNAAQQWYTGTTAGPSSSSTYTAIGNIAGGGTGSGSFGQTISTPYTSVTLTYTNASPAFSCSVIVSQTAPAPSQPSSQVIQAENMTSNNNPYTKTSAAASGGKYEALYRNGTLTGTYTSPSALNTVTVSARGSQCQGSPQMVVSVNGKQVLSTAVTAVGTWTNYTAPITTLAAGQSYRLVISYSNDHLVKNVCDRNLYVDSVTLSHP